MTLRTYRLLILSLALVVVAAGALLFHFHSEIRLYAEIRDQVSMAHDTGCPATSDRHWAESFTEIATDLKFIAHAGGGTPWGAYANTLDAMDYFYERGVRYFEIDFVWTRDEHLIGLYGWGSDFLRWYSPWQLPVSELVPPERLQQTLFDEGVALEVFKNLEHRCGLRQITPRALLAWMHQHDDAYLVSDVKKDLKDAAVYLDRELRPVRERIIFQIHSREQYRAVRDAGFRYVAYTNYARQLPLAEIPAYLDELELRAVVLHKSYLDDDSDAASIAKIIASGTPVWLHTVNNPGQPGVFEAFGIEAIMTDYLIPLQPD